jgi:hypothetical protein
VQSQAAYKVGDIKKAQRIQVRCAEAEVLQVLAAAGPEVCATPRCTQERLMTDDEKRAKGIIK